MKLEINGHWVLVATTWEEQKFHRLCSEWAIANHHAREAIAEQVGANQEWGIFVGADGELHQKPNIGTPALKTLPGEPWKETLENLCN